MMQASSCTTPAALGLPPSPTDWLGEVDSAKLMPFSTASRIEPPPDSTRRASSLDGFPKGHVEMISGASPLLAISAERVAEMVEALNKPRAVPPTNCLREMGITTG